MCPSNNSNFPIQSSGNEQANFYSSGNVNSTKSVQGTSGKKQSEGDEIFYFFSKYYDKQQERFYGYDGYLKSMEDCQDSIRGADGWANAAAAYQSSDDENVQKTPMPYAMREWMWNRGIKVPVDNPHTMSKEKWATIVNALDSYSSEQSSKAQVATLEGQDALRQVNGSLQVWSQTLNSLYSAYSEAIKST